jgi:hypothetical protein
VALCDVARCSFCLWARTIGSRSNAIDKLFDATEIGKAQNKSPRKDRFQGDRLDIYIAPSFPLSLKNGFVLHPPQFPQLSKTIIAFDSLEFI